MAILTRRGFVRSLSFASVANSLAGRHLPAQASAAAGSETNIPLQVGNTPGAVVPSDFVGLSYENMQLEDPLFFSPANKSLVEQFRRIAPTGVLRLGGNTSEFGWWKPRPGTVAPARTTSPWKATGEPVTATLFPITPEAIDNLDAFLRATGWHCIYGLNLGYGTPAIDLPEATYVYDKLGPRLAYFQIGNEVDLFRGHLRDPQTWNVETYLQQWLEIARAVEGALPGARFGLPDVASDVRWLPAVAKDLSTLSEKPNIVSMSHHYYWSGPPSNPEANVANLLKPDPKVEAQARLAKAAAEVLGPQVSWRMTEGNTVYRGGKSGVSDVFASALWSAGYLLELMALGYAGVNLHGGSGHAQAVSVGGVFHGEALMRDPEVPHPKPFYTPIANQGTLPGSGVNGKLNGTYLLEPVGFGMKFAAAFAGATMLPVTFDPDTRNASAYACRRSDGTTLVAVLNREAEAALTIACPPFTVISTLHAPSLEAQVAILDSGTSAPSKAKTRKKGLLTIPPHTATIVRLL